MAIELAHNKNLIIAEFDGDSNEVEGVPIQGFPTLKFYKGTDHGVSEGPIAFEGARTKFAMVAFLKENAFHPFTETKEEEVKTDL